MAKRKPKPTAELDSASAQQQGESREGLRKRIRDLQQELSRQVESNSRLRQSKFTLAKTGKAKPVKGSYRRVCVPDTHGCHVDQKAIAAFLGDLEHVQPQEIVLLGDHLDCGGFLAQHHTLGYVAETENGFEDDVVATNMLLDRLHELSPDSQKFYLEGNHDARLERWCVTQAMRKGTDAKFLLDRIGPQAVLHLEQRGIPYFRRSERYDGLPIPGTIKLGRCHFTHGEYTGKHAASQTLSRFGGNVVFGHCFSSDTEVLSESGWKTFDRLLVGEQVMTVSLSDGTSEWNPVKDVFSHSTFDKLVSFKSACIDARVTRDHAMVTVSRHARKMKDPLAQRTLRRVPASELLDKVAFAVPMGGVNRQDDYPISDDMLRFVGWVVTEGNVYESNGYSGYIRIAQSDTPKGGMEHLEKTLFRLGVKYTKKIRYQAQTVGHGQYRRYDAYRYNISRRDPACDEFHRLCPQKQLQPWMLRLSHRQWKILFETLILADGCKNKAAKNSFQFASNKAVDADIMQAACAVNGWRTTVRERVRNGAAYFVVTVNTNGIHTVGKTAEKVEVPNIDRVWCCSVDNQTLVVRRNGQAFVSGNTHRVDSFVQRTVHAGVIGAWNPGCLCKLQPYWNHTRLTDWSHGYGLQLVEPDGSFLHINVPIIEGRSYLASLLSM